jgi:uncharacterized protein HemX
MHDRIVTLKNHSHFSSAYFNELQEILMAFADSIAKLQADVASLVAQNGAAAVAAAVAAKDASDAAAVDAVDATVVAALAPAAPAAPAVVAPAAPAAPAA